MYSKVDDVCAQLKISCLVSLTLVSILSPTKAITSRCEATPVFAGERANVTCHFSSSIQDEKRFAVDRYGLTEAASQSQKDRVLSCVRISVNDFNCWVASGYKYLYSSSETTVFSVYIISAGTQHVGKFECTALDQDTQNIQFCDFTLKEKAVATSTFSPEQPGSNTTTSNNPTSAVQNGGSGYVIAAAVVPVLGLIVIASIIFFVNLRKLSKSTGKPQSPKQKNPDDLKSQEAQHLVSAKESSENHMVGPVIQANTSI